MYFPSAVQDEMFYVCNSGLLLYKPMHALHSKTVYLKERFACVFLNNYVLELENPGKG